MSLLSDVASSFEHLKKIEYRIVLSGGKNKPLEQIDLNFYDEDLFHILGLQHLTDIAIPKNKKKLISSINSGLITDEYLEKSDYYDNDELSYNIKHRIELASSIEDYLDSNIFSISIFKLQHDNRTFIKADYLISCKRNDSDEEYYIFIRRRKNEDYYGIVSCFKKSKISYWGGKRYLMLKEKIEDGNKEELFRHQNYKD